MWLTTFLLFTEVELVLSLLWGILYHLDALAYWERWDVAISYKAYWLIIQRMLWLENYLNSLLKGLITAMWILVTVRMLILAVDMQTGFWCQPPPCRNLCVSYRLHVEPNSSAARIFNFELLHPPQRKLSLCLSNEVSGVQVASFFLFFLRQQTGDVAWGRLPRRNTGAEDSNLPGLD